MDRRIEEILTEMKSSGLFIAAGGPWEDWLGSGRIVQDSRQLQRGDLFACVAGAHFDGHCMIEKAEDLGISGLLVQRPPESSAVPWIQVSDVRKATGFCASVLMGFPAGRLTMLGVTGTNGKSTTSYMVRSILQSCGVKCGLLGTVVYDDGLRSELADRTTPESVEIQFFLASMVSNGCGACAMECSSHGLVQGRLNGCLFDGAIFTNLTPEHLDYHGDMESYFQAKSRLFKDFMKTDGVLALNVDDPYGRRLAESFPQAMTWGFSEKARLRAQDLQTKLDWSAFSLVLDGLPLGRAQIPLSGAFNVANALGATALALALKLGPTAILQGLQSMPQVPGRMERLTLGTGAKVIIDYAHTPEALEKLLGALRPLVPGRLISLFGHGGDRFKGHRPLLGQAAAQWADEVFVTMDNPRTEDPVLIAREIAAGIDGCQKKTPYRIAMPRDQAIFQALERCEEGDLLVLSGKGPEPYLEIQGVKYPYSDKETVLHWARERGVTCR